MSQPEADIALHYPIAPRRFRIAFIALLVLFLGIIWGAALYSISALDHDIQIAITGTASSNPFDPLVPPETRPIKLDGIVITQRIAWFAGVLSTLVFALLWILYRWYSRYEASATEVANQARAMGAHLMVSECDPDGRIVRVNQAFIDATGYSREELIGQDHRILNSGFYPKDFYRNLWLTISAGRVWCGTFRNQTRSRGNIWLQATIVPFTDHWGRIRRYVALYSDISGAIAHLERAERERRVREDLTRIRGELASDSNLDALTGLPNRRTFATFADRMIQVERAARRPVSALMIELDFLDAVSDSHGLEAADEILVELAHRWRKLVRSSDMLARINPDAFYVLLSDCTANQAMIVAEKFRIAAVGEPISYKSPVAGAVEIPVSICIGVATASSVNEVGVEDILRDAELALHEAKTTGRDHVVARSLN